MPVLFTVVVNQESSYDSPVFSPTYSLVSDCTPFITKISDIPEVLYPKNNNNKQTKTTICIKRGSSVTFWFHYVIKDEKYGCLTECQDNLQQNVSFLLPRQSLTKDNSETVFTFIHTGKCKYKVNDFKQSSKIGKISCSKTMR